MSDSKIQVPDSKIQMPEPTFDVTGIIKTLRQTMPDGKPQNVTLFTKSSVRVVVNFWWGNRGVPVAVLCMAGQFDPIRFRKSYRFDSANVTDDMISTVLKAWAMKVWNIEACDTCGLHKYDLDDKTCLQCRAKGLIKTTFDEQECCICHEDAKLIERFCGTCTKVVCARCWAQYKGRSRCPVCRQNYASLTVFQEDSGEETE
jgi:hypothetical protein